MPTEHPRIQVTLDDVTHGLLSNLACKHEESKSACAASLIREALELHEDRKLSALSDSRHKNTKKWINHEDAWGDS